MERILISACLIGRPVRYNGTAKACGSDDILARWKTEHRLVSICPEISVGFPTPRPPAEIRGPINGSMGDFQGSDVLAGHASIVEDTGRDVTELYVRAAHETVVLAQEKGCRHAVLTDGSPSCGSSFIYDGTFLGKTKQGSGATAAALGQAGIQVWAETDIEALDAVLKAASFTE
ncbi:uncharacterized protein YbbK (DUF523 family) [Yoonia maricola]|uniref:Uncharacterized protein YbbK (DUF523 family) n=1 Tax=Yoonia maricola TaxID=420999 RepID=A0A2M8WMR7_9RHOB|nr:DUF523 domain-containing protein [Yoonia maricola]PJI92218.1 uncharacterized protein YbbK (DUF523 family) [Yoonia maricola]